MHDEAPAFADAARRSIRERVDGLGPALGRMRPAGMLAVLACAALWPVAAPLLGAGAAVGVATGVMGLLSAPGEAFITDALQRARRRGDSARDAQAELERALGRRLEGGDDAAAALRRDVATLLREVDGVTAALDASTSATRTELVRGFANLGETWSEFAWLLTQVHDLVLEILAVQRQQLEVAREQTIKLNRALAGPPMTRPPPPPAPRRRRGAAPADVPAPYRGLQRFEAADADLFFGRDRLRAELLARLAESRLLLLVGDSGSGKSSLLRAGLVRAIWDGALPGSAGWPVIVMTPGTRPLGELAMRVATVRGIAGHSLARELHDAPAALALAARQAVADEPDGTRLLIVVDQLEELFTMTTDEREQRAFLDALLIAVADPSAAVAIVCAIRGDFLGRLAAHPGAPEALRDNQVLVGPLSESELTSAIEGPAAYAGLTVQPGLTELVIAEVSGEPGALPLVSHALLETFDRRDGRELTVDGYRDAGGVRGALEQTADAVLARMTPGEREIARSILLRLTRPGERSEDTRRRASRADLVPEPSQAVAVEEVVDMLLQARLLTSGEQGVEVAHEALIRHWPALRRWIDEDREGHLLHDRLTLAAEEWRSLAQDPAVLYRGRPLAAAMEWGARHRPELNKLERDFLTASARAETDELDDARRRSRRLRALAVTLAVLLALVAGSALYALRQSDRADRERDAARRETRNATSGRLAAQAVAGARRDPDLSLLLALEAYRQAPTADARSALITALESAPRLRATLRGHEGGIAPVVAFARDPERLVTGGTEGTLRLWDAVTGRAVGRPLEVGGPIQSVAVSPDGHRVAAAWPTGFGLWALSRDGWSRRLGHHRESGVMDIAMGAATPLVATGLAGGSVQLWRGPRLRRMNRRLHVPAVAVTALAVARDTGDVAAGDDEGVIRIWDAGGHLLRTVETSAGAISDLAMAPDADRVAVAGATGVGLWDATTGWSAAAPSRAGRVNAVALDDRGRRAAAATESGVVELFGAAGMRREATLRTPHGASRGVAFAPGGGTLASTSTEGDVRLWDAGSSVPLAAARAAGPGPATVALGADARLLVAADAGGEILVSDEVGRRPPRAVAHVPDEPAAAAVSGDGRRVAVAGPGGHVVVWSRDGGARASMDLGPGRDLIALDRDGRLLASTGARDPTVRLWDVDAGKEVAALPADGLANRALAFSRDGGTLVAGRIDSTVKLWDVRQRKALGIVRVGRNSPVTALGFTADGHMLAAGGTREVVFVDLLRRRVSGRPLDTGGSVAVLAFDPSGRTLASTDGARIRLWDVPGRRSLGGALGGAGSVSALAFAPDGSLVSADGDGGATRWDPMLSSRRWVAWRDRVCRLAGRSLTGSEWAMFFPDARYEAVCSRPQATTP